jgi:hypothetical protein
LYRTPPPETTEGLSEAFDLVLFSGHEVSEVMVGAQWRMEIGAPATWNRLDRLTVETLIDEAVY